MVAFVDITGNCGQTESVKPQLLLRTPKILDIAFKLTVTDPFLKPWSCPNAMVFPVLF